MKPSNGSILFASPPGFLGSGTGFKKLLYLGTLLKFGTGCHNLVNGFVGRMKFETEYVLLFVEPDDFTTGKKRDGIGWYLD